MTVYGFRNNALKVNDLTVDNDLTILGDLSFGDVSTDTLTITGNLMLTQTDISAPLVMTNTITTAAKTGARALFNVKTNVAMGGWANALKGYMEFTGTSGRVTGLASAVVAEMKMPNTTLSSGRYYVSEIEYVAGGTSTTTSGSAGSGDAGFIWLKQNSDDDGDFDDNGFFMCITNMTAGAGHMLSANEQTLRSLVGIYGSESTKYFMLSDAEDVLSLGTFATPRSFITDTPIVMISGNAAADMASGVSRCAWFRAKVSDDQTANSILGIEAQCRIDGAALSANTLGAGQFTGAWCYWEQSGTTALNTGNLSSAISCTIEGASTLTVDSGAILAGVVIDSSLNASTTNNGRINGIYIKKASGALDFATGIEFTDCMSDEVFKFADDGAIVSVTNGSILNDIHGTANAGFIKVEIGTSTRYIAVYEAKA